MSDSLLQQLPARLNIDAYAGDTFTAVINVTVQDEAGNMTPADFTGSTAVMKIKARETDSVAILTLSSPANGITFPTASQIKIELTPAQTNDLAGASYKYDVQITDALGAVRTYMRGTFTSQKDVSW